MVTITPEKAMAPHSSTLIWKIPWAEEPGRCNTDLPKSCNTVCPRPESCDAPRALMSIAPNLCCDETKN